jgi:hypothetical protein
MKRDFSAQLIRWGLVDTNSEDCIACGNLGYIETQAASVTIDVPCPECHRSDWHAHDADLRRAEQ